MPIFPNIIIIFLSGGTTVTQLGTRTTYYTVNGIRSLGKLGYKLRNAATHLWQVSNTIRKFIQFTLVNSKNINIGGSATFLLHLLPLILPVVLGLHVLFSAFWPKRILFFHGRQRRRYVTDFILSSKLIFSQVKVYMTKTNL